MKKILKIFAIALVGVFAMSMVACNKGNVNDGTTMVVSTELLTFDAEGSATNASITVIGADWTATSSQNWITISPASGSNGGMFTVSVTEAPDETARQGSITVTNTANIAMTKLITVKQNGQDAVIGPRPGDVVLINGVGRYYYDVYDVGLSNFDMELSSCELNQYGGVLSEGYVVYLDFFSEDPASPISPNIAPGTYTVNDSYGIYTAIPGEYLEDWDDYKYSKVGRVDEYGMFLEKHAVTGGTYTVALDGDNYIVMFDLILSNGSEFHAFYNGPINVLNPYIETDLRDDLQLEPMSNGAIDFWGDFNYNGTYRYIVKMWTSDVRYDGRNFMGGGDTIQIEFYTEQGADETILPSGTYVVDTGYDKNAGTLSAGQYQQIIPDPEIPDWSEIGDEAPIVAGQITVSHSNGIYTMELDLADDAGFSITGTFNGTLDYTAYR